jgi:predicted branched-subunit amino acid permease
MRRFLAASPFVQGFRALLPIWFGAVPVACVYAVTARTAGLNGSETLLMSMIVFSAGTQLSAAGLLHAGASTGALIVTTVALNIHQVLLGFSLGQRMRLTWLQRWVAAYFLNDGAYGVTMSSGMPSFWFLLGAELSMFVVWNAATCLGILVGRVLPDLAWLGIDLVFPLLFLALLIPMVRSRVDCAVVLCAGCVALLTRHMLPNSLIVLVATLLASAVGAWRTCASGVPHHAVAEEQP